VEVVTGADVRGVRSEGDRVTGVETADGVLGADQVVLAAGAWCATIKGSSNTSGSTAARSDHGH
jgi:glycine/D-amino acid oxidase-like deaminating enzyme